jgi:toxin ParE1/3/4
VKSVWTVRLSESAEHDYREILGWTQSQFGPQQAKIYADTIASALRDLGAGPSLIEAKPREDIGPGIHTLHVARKGRKGRHFVLFRIAPSQVQQTIDVLRLLHDRMDLPRHVPD